MKKAVPLILIVGILGLFLPAFILNAHAFGCTTPCQVQVINHVPSADRPAGIRVQLDGGAISTMNQTYSFTNSSTHSITVLDTYFVGAQSGQRYQFKQWTYTGTGTQQDSSPTMTVCPIYSNFTTATCRGTLNCPFLAEFTVTPPLGCKTNCNLDALTNVPTADGPIKVQLDGSAVYSLGQTFSFPNGTVHTIRVLNSTFTGAGSGARYVWKQWSCTCGVSPTANPTLTTPQMYLNYTVSQSGAFTAQFDKQFPLTLSFADQNGNAISNPKSLVLVNGATTINLTSYSGVWESARVWNVNSVVWEGIVGIEIPGQTIDLTAGPVSRAVVLRAYSATVKTVDRANNPIAGVSITVSFANSTTRTFQTDSQGLVLLGYIPLGRYTALVTYQGANVCSCSTDASLTNPLVVQIPVGNGTPTTTAVSAIVLLTIFGLAAFLVILAIRVRKPPPPPSFD